MAGVKVYESTVLPQVPNMPNATPDMFGAGVGRALENLGRSQMALAEGKQAISAGFDRIGASANSIADKLYEQQVRDEVTAGHKIISDGKKFFQERLLALRNESDPGDRTFHDRAMKEVDEYYNQKSAQITTRLGQENFARDLDSAKMELSGSALGLQVSMLGQHAVNQGEDIFNNYSTIVSRDPSQIETSRAALEKAIDNPSGVFHNMPPQDREKYKIEKLQKLDLAAMLSLSRKSPKEILDRISPETLDRMKTAKANAQNTPPGMPADLGADTVKPYSEKQLTNLAQRVDNPSVYDATFEAAARKFNLDPRELKMRSIVESGLDPNAKSSQGAGGIMQMTEETARGLGVNRFDPTESIFGAARLLRKYKDQAGGDPTVVDMLYYGGPDKDQWGPNTKQYAANQAALRLRVGLGNTRSPESFAPGPKDITPTEVNRSGTGIGALDRLNSENYMSVINHADHYQRTYQTAQDAARVEKARTDNQVQQAILDGVVRRIVAPTQENGGPITIDEITNGLKGADVDTRTKAINMYWATQNHLSSPKPDDPEALRELFSGIFTETKTGETYDLEANAYKSMIDGRISPNTYSQFHERALRDKDEFGRSIAQTITSKEGDVWAALKENPMFRGNPGGYTVGFQLWQRQFEDAVDAAKKAGEDPRYLWDPRDKRNMISPDFVRGFLPSARQSLSAGAAAQANKEAPAFPTVKTDADFDALPPKTKFIGPDGKLRMKP